MACFIGYVKEYISRDPQLQDWPLATAAALPLWRLPVAKEKALSVAYKMNFVWTSTQTA